MAIGDLLYNPTFPTYSQFWNIINIVKKYNKTVVIYRLILKDQKFNGRKAVKDLNELKNIVQSLSRIVSIPNYLMRATKYILATYLSVITDIVTLHLQTPH